MPPDKHTVKCVYLSVDLEITSLVSNIALLLFPNTRDPVSLGSSLLCLGQDLGKMFLQRGWP